MFPIVRYIITDVLSNGKGIIIPGNNKMYLSKTSCYIFCADQFRPQLPPQHEAFGQLGAEADDGPDFTDTAKVDNNFSISSDPHDLQTGFPDDESMRYSATSPHFRHLYS